MNFNLNAQFGDFKRVVLQKDHSIDDNEIKITYSSNDSKTKRTIDTLIAKKKPYGEYILQIKDLPSAIYFLSCINEFDTLDEKHRVSMIDQLFRSVQ